jgi:hypothetical protein
VALLVVDCKCIFSPIVGVRDHRDDRNDMSIWYYFIVGRDYWGEIFYDLALGKDSEVMGASKMGANQQVVPLSKEPTGKKKDTRKGRLSDEELEEIYKKVREEEKEEEEEEEEEEEYEDSEGEDGITDDERSYYSDCSSDGDHIREEERVND